MKPPFGQITKGLNLWFDHLQEGPNSPTAREGTPAVARQVESGELGLGQHLLSLVCFFPENSLAFVSSLLLKIVDVPMKNCDFTIRKLLVYQRNQPVLVNKIWFCLTSQVRKMGHCQEKVRKCMGRLIWTDAQVSFFENRFIIFRLKLSFWTATYYTVGYIYSIIQLIYIPSIIRWLFLKPLVLSKLYATQYPNSYRLSQWYPYFGTQSIINITLW